MSFFPSRAAIVLIAALALSACATNRADLAAQGTAGLPPRVELADVPFYPQDEYQCGPAALATVLQRAGLSITPQELTGDVYLPGKKGSLQTELVAAARARDRLPYSVEPQLRALLDEIAAGRPVLVMQNLGLRTWPAWHFAVLIGYDIDTDELVLRSGTTQRLTVDAGRFMKTWDRAQRWGVVMLEPDELPASADLGRYMSAAAGLEAVGRLDAAERAYGTARMQWLHSAWPVVGLANVRYSRGNLPAAEAAYNEALAIEPDNPVAHNNLAEILAARKCVASARLHVERALALAKGTGLESSVAATAERLNTMDAQSTGSSCPTS